MWPQTADSARFAEVGASGYSFGRGNIEVVFSCCTNRSLQAEELNTAPLESFTVHGSCGDLPAATCYQTLCASDDRR